MSPARLVPTVLVVLTALILSTWLFWQVDVINRGGPVMIPIVMCSIFALTIAIERLYYLITRQGDVTHLVAEVREALIEKKWDEAVRICRASKGALAKVIQAGLAVRERAPLEIDRAMEEAALDELPAVEKHLRWLPTIAQVATLLGLLGTVTGMVRAFQVIERKATAANPVSPGDLAGGIWEALTTTVAGLEVAIPTILIYNYLVGRVAEIRFQMEKATNLLTNPHAQAHAHAAAKDAQ